MRKFFILILIALLPLAFTACGDKKPKKTQVKRATVKKAAKKAPLQAAKKLAKVSEEPEFKISKRNPFKSFIVDLTVEDDGRVRGPLECCEVELFKLMAVVKGKGKPRAIIRAPDGKRYTVTNGQLIGMREGTITEIKLDRVVVLELTRDTRGKVTGKELIEISLPTYEERRAGKKR